MKRDSQIFDLIGAERKRQTEGIELIASENYVSDQVMEAMGSVLTNKYAEGYPGARYYGGCEVVDRVETLAIERVCRLYGAEYANVQPHSGAQANMAVFFAVLKPGDTFMGSILRTADTCRTARRSTCRACISTPSGTNSTSRPAWHMALSIAFPLQTASQCRCAFISNISGINKIHFFDIIK